MPQILVTRTGGDEVDWEGLATALNRLAVEKAGARLEACKTHVFRGEDLAVGADTGYDQVLAHVTFGLLAGRSDETKAQLTEAAVDLMRTFIGPQDGRRAYVSAEVRDLDPSYRKAEF
ncbi:5-carboxymethyl-2-hydroxymuconate Delta-isomerase [Streptomyces sp. DH41]|uniref:5-carboxymethyl-2-hydroxymuconate Delta-isomerase n=1 Tax=Streptomyces sp. DH41 TaxID=3040125 RepID=UPI0024428590|nr:isomerase [Streptomyces sp. DH41]MDG9725837.1 isomerase [Streptomyces sp. DH41]